MPAQIRRIFCRVANDFRYTASVLRDTTASMDRERWFSEVHAALGDSTAAWDAFLCEVRRMVAEREASEREVTAQSRN